MAEKIKDKECRAYKHTYKCESDTCVGCEYRNETDRDIPKDPIRNDKCTCPSCGTHNEIIKKRRNTVHHDVVYCWRCGQAIKVEQIEEPKESSEKASADKFWDMYKQGEIVYPNAVMRYFRVSQTKAREMCDKLVAEGKLMDLYILRCPCCGHDVNQKFYSKRDIPDDMYCDYCDTEFDGVAKEQDRVYEVI